MRRLLGPPETEGWSTRTGVADVGTLWRDDQYRRARGHGGAGCPVIQTSGLTRRFGDRVALRDINLNIEEGEIYGCLGANGAGKSTLVHILTTLLAPSAGSASIAGLDVQRHSREVRQRIGVTLQEAALDPLQTGRSLIRLQGRLHGLDRDETTRRLDSLLSLIDLTEAIDEPISCYSGGMKRRLDLAAALIPGPRVLFLDEPTTGLDPSSRTTMWDELLRLNETYGVTILLTTQYMEEADRLAHRVGVLSHGRMVVEGSPDELKLSLGSDVIELRLKETARPDLAAVCLAIEGITEALVQDNSVLLRTAEAPSMVAPVVLALSEQGVQIRDLSVRRTTLEDAFLQLSREQGRDDDA
jgi:ABC-2 type transport system ATP-binding protein